MRPDPEAVLIAGVGARLKALRLAAKLTHAQAAERFGCEIRNYQRMESGKINLSLRTVARLAEALQVGPREIIPGGAP